MSILSVRRLAADILGVGQLRIWINPDELEEVGKMATRSDVRGLIDKGIVKKMPFAGRLTKPKRKRRSAGSIGGRSASTGKRLWMAKVRAQRKLLASLVENGTLQNKDKRAVYNKIKSGIFRSKRAMVIYLKENELISADFEVPVQAPKPKQAPMKAQSRALDGKKAPGKTQAKPTEAPPLHTTPQDVKGGSEKKGEHR